jgi:hypothetical protein
MSQRFRKAHFQFPVGNAVASRVRLHKRVENPRTIYQISSPGSPLCDCSRFPRMELASLWSNLIAHLTRNCKFLVDGSEPVEFHFGSLFLSVLVLFGGCPWAHDESMMDFLKAVLSS